MPEKETIVINDDLFLNTVSCPLKFTHITNNCLNRDSSKLYFRQRNKLHIRDAIANRFENNRQTSNSTKDAANETKTWLKRDHVSICGAVIQHNLLLTRIPILVKEDEKLTIIQVHGKLRKRSEGDEIKPGIKKRSIIRYLLKAAYRLEVLRRNFPESEIDIHFYFPDKHFKSSAGNLHLFDQPSLSGSERIEKQLNELFRKVRATDAVKHVSEQIPSEQSYQIFHGKSVSEAIQKIELLREDSTEQPKIDRHRSCKYCDFRLPGDKGAEGCWSQFFPTENIQHPEKHIFELIGQGNRAESENGTYYQEEAEFSRSFDSLKDLTDKNTPTITILNRRNLQILKARDREIPSLWLKQRIKLIDDLAYPLHFLDFEAATYALPMKKETRPYTPAYFQFSCHTLRENGELIHTEWLDMQAWDTHPHAEFVQQLGKVPGICEGTIMQYSPFEKQGVNRLIADLGREDIRYQDELEILEKIRRPKPQKYEHRFFDVSRIIRDYYFNEYLNDSLGLKQVLKSILQWEQASELTDFLDDTMNEILYGETRDQHKKNLDPYKNYQNSNFSINDGSDAMNAWLSFKNGLMSEDEKEVLPGILKKYCTLDSYALFVIFKHIKQFTKVMGDEDYILFQ
ncbi:MAG: DUF2779 domain-containing protein [Balneolaceae bacterium]|nr:DUF2779 domain-containing protein [Balneolaceae bacterium]